MFGETIAQNLTGTHRSTAPKKDLNVTDNGYRPGIVTIIDIQSFHDEQVIQLF